ELSKTCEKGFRMSPTTEIYPIDIPRSYDLSSWRDICISQIDVGFALTANTAEHFRIVKRKKIWIKTNFPCNNKRTIKAKQQLKNIKWLYLSRKYLLARDSGRVFKLKKATSRAKVVSEIMRAANIKPVMANYQIETQRCILIFWTPRGMLRFTVKQDANVWEQMVPILNGFHEENGTATAGEAEAGSGGTCICLRHR
ncbi:hypothetical protein PV326_013841, partial [Microctonus aethiopoides]